jgi:hypothetical protein
MAESMRWISILSTWMPTLPKMTPHDVSTCKVYFNNLELCASTMREKRCIHLASKSDTPNSLSEDILISNNFTSTSLMLSSLFLGCLDEDGAIPFHDEEGDHMSEKILPITFEVESHLAGVSESKTSDSTIWEI